MSDREVRDMQEQIDAVQRMQDYIGSHLTEEITLADLAGVSLFSPWYSYRLLPARQVPHRLTISGGCVCQSRR